MMCPILLLYSDLPCLRKVSRGEDDRQPGLLKIIQFLSEPVSLFDQLPFLLSLFFYRLFLSAVFSLHSAIIDLLYSMT